MADQPLALRSDRDLEAALRAFAEEVDWPGATSAPDGRDVASLVRARIESSPRPVVRHGRAGAGGRHAALSSPPS